MVTEYGREGEGGRERGREEEREGERERDLTRSTQYRYTDGLEDVCAGNGRDGGDLADCCIGMYY